MIYNDDDYSKQQKPLKISVASKIITIIPTLVASTIDSKEEGGEGGFVQPSGMVILSHSLGPNVYGDGNYKCSLSSTPPTPIKKIKSKISCFW